MTDAREEAVARALQRENRPRNDMLNSEQRAAEDDATLPAYLALARAAIAALPTEEALREAYEEGVEDGIGWHAYPESGPRPLWIDSCARVDMLQRDRALLTTQGEPSEGKDHE